jgi:hypothetical protein
MISSFVIFTFPFWQKEDCQVVVAVSNTIFSATEIYMKLRKWLDQQKLTNREFAVMIDVSDSAIHRWTSTDDDKRIPRPEHMLAIEKATRGKVKAQDFYS